MKCVVTGGAGFIGSNLVDGLLKRGDSVIVIDDLSLGKKENLPKHKNLVFHKETICREDIKSFFSDVEVVFHLAALPRVQFSVQEPIKTNEVNINGTLNLLNACREAGVKRFVFSSSSSIYGDQDKMLLTESMKPNPMSPYALHKLTGEYYCRLYNRIHRMETVSLRYFNVYGPRQSPDGGYACLIPKFVKLVNNGEQPVINGDGEQTRDFTYVGDVVNANVLAATTKNKEVFGEAFNIGAGRNISVNKVTCEIIKLSGKRIKAKYGPAVIEPKHTLADYSKAKKFLGWAPKTGFEGGLKRAYEDMTKRK